MLRVKAVSGLRHKFWKKCPVCSKRAKPVFTAIGVLEGYVCMTCFQYIPYVDTDYVKGTVSPPDTWTAGNVAR